MTPLHKRPHPAPATQELHIIIFDEIDAICKSRGTVRDGTATHDTIVNQLLTKIDGVDALNNILLIGMTNRWVLPGFVCRGGGNWCAVMFSGVGVNDVCCD